MIGYYVHHHGAGHLTRARVLASALRSRGCEVMLLGSDLRGAPGVSLPADNDGPPSFSDPDASGALHWAPMHHDGFSARMQTLAEWVRARKPQAVVVDVSVEVTAFLRLLGVPTVVVAQPGDRSDDAHTLAYRCATAILAPWPAEAQPCPALSEFAEKITYTGGISGLRSPKRTPQSGLVLAGRGGASVTSDASTQGPALMDALSAAVPGMTWVEAGGHRWVSEIGPMLARAHVVVSHGGQNAIADIATLDVPAVVCPQPRPHAEQEHLGAELSRLGLATVAFPDGASMPDWAALVEAAMHTPSEWDRWQTDQAATRAAELILDVTRG